jgi:hypothetical protein
MASNDPELHIKEIDEPEPRWGVLVALVASAALYLVLAKSLMPGPPWIPLACVAVLEVPAWIAIANDREVAAIKLGHAISAALTLFLAVSVALLVKSVITGSEPAIDLLRSAVALWFVNIFVFASWYWRLDAGGPLERGKLPGHHYGAFYFPQMSMPDEVRQRTCEKNWRPGFVDYLFLAFNTSTALSPADTGALTRWAKTLMMIQSVISLTIIVLLAARAVNILPNNQNSPLIKDQAGYSRPLNAPPT